MTDILSGNTNPKVNPFWGKFALTGPEDERRPATLKTGTNNDAKDLNAYGFIAPPTDAGRQKGEYALAVGAWNGNSDNSVVAGQVFSIDVTTFVWQGFLQEATKTWADQRLRAARRPRPGEDRPVHRPQAAARRPTTIDEWFIAGTAPKDTIPEGLVRPGRPRPRPASTRHSFTNWMTADLDWLNRARARTRHGRRRQPDPDGVLLQRPVPAVRAVVGRRSSRAMAARRRARR